MEMFRLSVLEQLCFASGVAGREQEVRRIIQNEGSTYADEVLYDGLGSIILHKKGSGKKVLFSAHMDEVGYLIRGLTKEGMLKVMPLGSILPLANMFQPVVVTTADNNKFYGEVVSDLDEKGTAQNTYIDLGLDSLDEVMKLGIGVGDMATFSTPPLRLSENRFCAKALDDRVGCFILLELLKQVHVMNATNRDLYFAFTSSEEVGTRGAKTCANMVKPDVAVVVDVADYKNQANRGLENQRQLGRGPMLVHYDKSCVCNRAVMASLRNSAKAVNAPYQEDMFAGGGTDGGAIHLAGDGVPTGILGIPLRYCHTPNSICDLRDIKNGVEILKQWLSSLEEQFWKRLRTFDIS